MLRQAIATALGTGLLLAATGAAAQTAGAPATVRDGQWRGALGAGASLASGNTDARSVNLAGDLARATAVDKWSLYGTGLYGRSGDTTTAKLWRAGTRYDRELGGALFGFGLGELEHNAPANLGLRATLGGGLGMHLLATPEHSFDVFGGLAWTRDAYRTPTTVGGVAGRTEYAHLDLMLGEESRHVLTATTTLRQKLVVFPNLKDTGEYRATWDAGVGVAISKTMNLTAGLSWRYNSDPGGALKKTDTLLVTGVSMTFN